MLERFAPATRAWFQDAFQLPTAVQTAGWEAIAAGQHALLLAPTGSGKTLAAFLWAVDCQLREAADAAAGARVLYVSPLKALVYDIERNLRAPLVGILRAAERLGQPCRQVEVDIRTGDTAASDRRRQLKSPADILVTTPESLYLLLGSQAAHTLRSVHTVIVDEIHALAPTKRGAHLALSLERLSAWTHNEPQRIGLSATVRPHEEAARYLGGDRAVTVVDKAQATHVALSIVVPVANMEQPPPVAPKARPGGPILGELLREEKEQQGSRRDAGMWAAIYPTILDLIRKHRSTIIFVNSRSLCERLAQRLNDLADEELVRAHHGSLALKRRAQIEDELKAGTLRGIVATSSLELGVDMGAVDLVLLVESPGSVARGLQRVGRAGHQVGEVSRGIMLPKFRGDLLECVVVGDRMRAGALEAVEVPHNALDVLAQQLVAMCVQQPQTVAVLAQMVRRAYSYSKLSDELLVATLEMLSGTYPSDEFADLRPHLSWDRATDVVSPRRGARLAALLNAGTIADRGLFGVFLGADGPRVGELDEEMVYESRVGEVFLLGASSWRVEQITRDKVLVSPAPGEPGRLPFWRGDSPGRPVQLGRAVGAFVRHIDALGRGRAQAHLTDNLGLDTNAAANLLDYLGEQRAQTGTLPTDRSITVERFKDEIGDWRVCILTPFGARVHAPWALALEASLSQKAGFTVQTLYSDEGIVLRFADGEAAPEGLDSLLLDPAEIEDLVVGQLAQSAMFATNFRENAARALLLPRRRATGRTPLWQQRLKAKMLLAAAQRYPAFPIILETYRQCLKDVFDLPALVDLLSSIRRRDVGVDYVETPSASPFARSLVFAYVAAYLYEQDAPLAERRAQALTLDRDLLRELLGQAELRELIDIGVLDALEADLQGLSPERQARDADELHDLLRRLGDLTAQEASARCQEDALPWLAALQAQRRASVVRIAGEDRFIANEDAGRYRDALGVMPPSGLPERFIAAVDAPLESLVRRYAHTHGPFLAPAPASRFGLLPAQLEPVLRAFAKEGTLVHGELRPGGREREWCDAEVLRRLKRATLAKLRREVAAVDTAALATFLWRWHRLDRRRRGPQALDDILQLLEGFALSWSALVQTILPARLDDFQTETLDALCASGSLVWVGCRAAGPGDGKIKLLRRTQAPLLLDPPLPYEAPSATHSAILAHLEKRGACFSVELSQVAALGSLRELDGVLWDLVWSGQITNDTVQPLRGLASSQKKALAPTRRGGAGPVFGGRWYRVADLLEPRPSPTACAHARATMLLQRHGVVTRETAASEDLKGGFSAIYGVLKTMEETGKVRRGYFVEGLSGAQFAYGGAVERLRAQREARDRPTQPDVQVMCSLDPANPYGTVLPWPATAPDRQRHRPRRVAASQVILLAGEPLACVESKARRMLTFPAAFRDADSLTALLCGLRQLASQRRGRVLHLTQIDGQDAHGHEQGPALLRAGAGNTFDGYMIEATDAGR